MMSLEWVDCTYVVKHKSDEQPASRGMYYENLKDYPKHGQDRRHPYIRATVANFAMRSGKRAGLSLIVFFLSYIPIVGRFVLPAASYYTFQKAVGPVPAGAIFGFGMFLPRRYLVTFLQSYFASRSLMRELLQPYFVRVQFTTDQKRRFFRDREGVLFGFGVGFYLFLKIPLLGVLIYGIAEASTAYLITKVTAS